MKRLFATVFLSLILVSAAVPTSAAGPKVTLTTSMGVIVLELNPDKAPNTVANFVQYARSGFFKGTLFHRVMPGFMIQGGGFTTDFDQKATEPPIRNEADNGLLNVRGSIAMARTYDPHSASAQFFINLVDNHGLNYRARTLQGWGYAVFGRVIEGMRVVDQIAQVETGNHKGHSDVPVKPVIIEQVSVE